MARTSRLALVPPRVYSDLLTALVDVIIKWSEPGELRDGVLHRPVHGAMRKTLLPGSWTSTTRRSASSPRCRGSSVGKVPALVVTLGTMYIYRGIVLTWAGSERIDASNMPDEFLRLGTMQIASIPLLTIVAVVVLIGVGYYLATARGGREMYAIGSDPEAATLYGLPVTKRVIYAFIVSGALAGLAGVMYAARYGTVSAGAGTAWELEAIGAAVIGGVAIFGGSGTVWGAAFGAILLMTINRTLPMIGVPDFWQRAVVGAMIIGAIVLDRYLAVRQRRKLQEARDEE